MADRLFNIPPPSSFGTSLRDKAEEFCNSAPYRQGAYAKRNWGGTLHSLCSYQGKLKPSIAHFLVSWFTDEGQRVLDPLSGVGTIPLEARLQGRIGLASDLSPMADAVCRAKLETFNEGDVWSGLQAMEEYVGDNRESFADSAEGRFGLNGPIENYFHPTTLNEVLASRQFLLKGYLDHQPVARDVLKTNIMHILHGNRPYALSRRSHPVTPFAPSGPVIYRPLIDALKVRLDRVMPPLMALDGTTQPGSSHLADFRHTGFDEPVDAVITSPPFSKSVRFWSSNWMRLWYAGWSPEDFKQSPAHFLEVEQKKHLGVYSDFAQSMHSVIKPGGLLIMHLGETKTVNMAEAIGPLLSPLFDIEFAGRECVADTESHGLRDKGATLAHWYLFARAR